MSIGLEKASSGLLNRLVGGLSSGQAQQLIAKHEQTVQLCASAAAEGAPSRPPQLGRTFSQMAVQSRRAHMSRPLSSRLNAAKLFTDFARKEGFRLDERIPYGKMAEFLRKTCDSSLSQKELKSSRYAMRRAVELFLSGKAPAPPCGCHGTEHRQPATAVFPTQAAARPPWTAQESPDAPHGIVGLVLQHQAVGVWPNIAEDGAQAGEDHGRELCTGLLSTRRASESACH